MDKKNRVPLYLQLMDTLIEKIDTGEFRIDEKLPSERELCELFDMSRITVRQTLQELEREGYIYKSHGKGTFVAPSTYNQNLINLYSFTEEMKALGKKPVTNVLSFNEIEIDERIATKMNLKPLDEVFQVVRLRNADDEPLMYETSYLPKKHFPQLTKQDLQKRPMYDVFNEDYQIIVTRATERFSATTVREEEAKHLQTKEGHPAMLIKRYAYHNQSLIEYTISVARADKFDYTVELT